MQLFNLEKDIGLVTGALGKLGPIWVQTLLGAGARVLALDRPGTPEAPAFQELQARFGSERLALAFADVCRRPELEAALDRCGQIFGSPPTILVNNAGIDAPPATGGKAHRLEEIPLAVNLRILEVNTAGLFLVTQVFGGAMAKAHRGSIINIGSLYASVSPDARFYDHIPGDPPLHQAPGLRRFQGGRARPDEIPRGPPGALRRARQCTLAGRRPGRPG